MAYDSSTLNPMPSSVENALTTYKTQVGNWNNSLFLRDISSITFETPRTSTPSFANWSSMRWTISARASFLISSLSSVP